MYWVSLEKAVAVIMYWNEVNESTAVGHTMTHVIPQFAETVCDRHHMPSNTGGSHSLEGDDNFAIWSLAFEQLSMLYTLGLEQYNRMIQGSKMREFLLSHKVYRPGIWLF